MSFKKTNPKGMKSDWKRVANTRHLTRIIIYLSEVKCDCKTGMRNKGIAGQQYVDDALNFLVNHKIIFVFRTQRSGRWASVKYYALNPLSKK